MEAATPFPAAETRCAQEAAGGAAPVFAYVDGGVLFVMEGGLFWPMRELEARAQWLIAATSPYPAVQERARQIRVAMDDAYPERLVA